MSIQTSDHLQGAGTFIEMLVLPKTYVYPACEQRVGQIVVIVGALFASSRLITVASHFNTLRTGDADLRF